MLVDIPYYNDYEVIKLTDDENLKMFFLKETNSLYQVIRGTWFSHNDDEIIKELESKEMKPNRKYMILSCEWENGSEIYLHVEAIQLPLDWFDSLAKSKKWTKQQKRKKLNQIASIFTESMGFSKYHSNTDWIMYNFEHIDRVILECLDIVQDLRSQTKTDEEFCQKLTKALHSTIKYDEKFMIGGQQAFVELSEKYPETFNIFTPVIKRYGVCESIAPLFAFIRFLADIQVEIIYWINDPWVNHYNCFHKGKIYDPTFWESYIAKQEEFEERNFEIL